jgi:hypothetical protein
MALGWRLEFVRHVISNEQYVFGMCRLKVRGTEDALLVK